MNRPPFTDAVAAGPESSGAARIPLYPHDAWSYDGAGGRRAGVTPELLRISVGIEDPIADFPNAFKEG